MNFDLLLGFIIHFEFVFFSHYFYEIITVLLVGKFDSKIINNKGKQDVSEDMSKKSVFFSRLGQIHVFQMLDKAVICNTVRLF